MNSLFPNAALEQNKASNPQTSAWVAASAGAGKTKVLTDRLLRLFLENNEPHRILCLTFTKAAAAEMANRLYQKLSHWAMLEESQLTLEFQKLNVNSVTPETYALARSLFTKVLDTPGGLKILTIHGFCQALLKRFPLEAKIPAHFEILDQQAAAELLGRAQASLFNKAEASEAEARALDVIAHHFETSTFSELLEDLQSFKGLAQENSLDFPPLHAEQSLLRSACAIDQEEALRQAGALLLHGKKTDQEQGRIILEWLNNAASRSKNFEAYMRAFFTTDYKIRKKLCTVDLERKHPQLKNILFEEALRLEKIREELNAIRIQKISASLSLIGKSILNHYARLKIENSFLDYDDLIEKTVSLLNQAEFAPWVLYKLDGGLDHILVDEAQDTSPSQWKIISTLAKEFFYNVHETSLPRTLFVVGDAKQSIYSFQGAEPQEFIKMGQSLEKFNRSLKRPWIKVDLDTSFRSSEAILAVVDQVFKADPLKSALLHSEQDIKHHAFRRGQAGLVELWPICAAEKREDPPIWELPVQEYASPMDTALEVAQLMAKKIKGLLDSQEILPSTGMRIKASDILILVQRRGDFVPKLIKTLKHYNIPVAGSDRMILTDQLIVKDLLALGEFLLLPTDDLALATVLKSPLYSLSEDDLQELCIDRKGSLWAEVLRSKKHREISEKLKHLLNSQDIIRPYELYMEVLYGMGGKKNFLRRLGHECLDPMEEFLNQIIGFEKNSIPTLQNFIHYMQKSSIEVKRDFEQGAQDEVRVMTVHGAKGLQSPIVILPDTVHTPLNVEKFLQTEDQLLWAPPAAQDTSFTQQLKSQASHKRLQEYWRLLYVAMTRAEDRLYIYGWQSRGSASQQNWHSVIASALQRIGYQKEDIWRYESQQAAAFKFVPQVLATPAAASLPPWIHKKTLPETKLKFWTNPSKHDFDLITADENSHKSSPFSADYAALRGTLVHKLLENFSQRSIPDQSSLLSYLKNPFYSLTAEQQEEIASHVLKILASPVYRSFIGPYSYFEVPIIGRFEEKNISGQIDLLVEEQERVLIIDFKTHALPPLKLDEVSIPYLNQMRLYNALVKPLYPAKKVVSALFWTETLNLMILPKIPE